MRVASISEAIFTATASNAFIRSSSSEYCFRNRCYTLTEFVLFGVGASLIGIMLGILAISWLKQCLPHQELEQTLKPHHTQISRFDSEFSAVQKKICQSGVGLC